MQRRIEIQCLLEGVDSHAGPVAGRDPRHIRDGQLRIDHRAPKACRGGADIPGEGDCARSKGHFNARGNAVQTPKSLASDGF
jgi:hypothetical protein